MTNQRGFSIIELLVVVLVIAVLATISVVSYNGIQNRAYDTAVRDNLKQFMTELESTKAQTYKFPTVSDMQTMRSPTIAKDSYKIGISNLLYCVSADQMTYAVIAASKSSKAFVVSSATNSQVKDFTPAFTGATTSCADASVTSASALFYYEGGSWKSFAR